MRNFYKPGVDDVDSDSSIDIADEAEMMFEVVGEEDVDDDDISDDPEKDDSSDDDFNPSDPDSDDSDVQEQQKANGDDAEAGSSEAGPSSANLNEEEEDDDTVKAIIAAIKKPRFQPPEIKLDDFVTDISFHTDEDILAIATITGDVLLYKYSNEENTLLKSFEVHTKACRDIEFSEDGKILLSCSKDKSVMLTDVETGKLKKFYDNAHNSAIYTLYVVDENLFATGDDSGTVKLWDSRTETPVFALKEVEDYISAILTNDAKKLLLFTSGDGYLTTINMGSRKLYVQSEPYEEELTCMNLFRNDSKVIIGTSKGRFYSFNWGEFGYHSDMFPGMKAPIGVMVPLTDRIGCVSGEDGVLRAAHIAPFRNLGIVGQHSLSVESLDINHSGEYIASSSHNNDVRFWNVKYFEDFGDIKYNDKHNTYRERRHNLPSSKVSNASDFFADLAGDD
ncbi:WD repeat-containing protein 55 homolog [Hermetia illucens]|nr:WD repeat-containing protein 55 homolog [Hermetia illucens]